MSALKRAASVRLSTERARPKRRKSGKRRRRQAIIERSHGSMEEFQQGGTCDEEVGIDAQSIS